MSDDAWFPPEPYLTRADEPQVRPGRPICQGDVFLGLPRVRGTQWKRNRWVPKASVPPEALSILVAHPCSARSNATHRLKEDIGLAPVMPVPENWGPPWRGYFEMFPLPGLYKERDFVADLSRVFPVLPEHLADRRIACLNREGLAALLDRLARNATRLEPVHVPGHFESEAERLLMEFDLWELWVEGTGSEEGFQEWLDGPWMETSTRRHSLRGHYEEIEATLAQELGRERDG